MMRSRAHSSRSLKEMVVDNPFLCAAFLAGLALAALHSDLGSSAILQTIWAVLGFGFHLTSSWTDKLMPAAAGWLAAAMAFVLGLIPYLLADMIWRRLRSQ